MSELQSLDDVLSGNESMETPEATPTAEVETEVEIKAEAETETPEVETETPETPKEDATAASDVEEEWTKTMALDERRKRQELERKLEALESQKEAPKAPDVFESQEDYTAYMTQQMDAKVGSIKLELSQDMMRGQYSDYDELEAEFLGMAQDNPVLIQELQTSANPARYAYETAKKARDAAQLKDIDSYKEKIKAELREQILSEMKASQAQSDQKAQEKRDAITPSLAETTSKSGLDAPVDESLDDILAS